MAEGIIDASRGFFGDIVQPLLEKHFPDESQHMAIGLFGYGSECLRMDDELSRDHHWGLRVDVLMPDEMFRTRADDIRRRIGEELPHEYGGFSLREGHVAGSGLLPESLEGFLKRTIGLPGAPQTLAEWLDVPEVDIIHVTNGELWYDPSGRFSVVREALLAYYPEPVWLRRISHWCRYCSGMGLYALNRAVKRGNDVYAFTAFSRSIKWSIELAFMLNRQYFPYDKWLYDFFKRLPELADRMDPLIVEAVQPQATWERRTACLEGLADILDEKMVQLGVIPPHARFEGSQSSSYRLLEHAYAVIVQRLPAEVKSHVPCWDQIPLEEFHTAYVDSIPIDDWDRLLNLTSVD